MPITYESYYSDSVDRQQRWKAKLISLSYIVLAGTGIITKTELKFFYTAFMDVGKLGDAKLEDFTNNAYEALTSVSLLLKNSRVGNWSNTCTCQAN